MPRPANRLRIIGGQWRGRRLRFADSPGLRPTPDRLRETLFNWLQPVIPGACCLDLFAGSGALGFESLSRGAASVILVEQSPLVVDALRQARTELAAEALQIVQADVLTWLRGPPQPADLVFLDPPFDDTSLLSTATTLLETGGWLKDGSRIYVEQPRKQALPALPASWVLHRDKAAGNVASRLYVRQSPPVA